MRNTLDDYLYDNVRVEYGIDFDNNQIKEIIDISMQLAENNFDIFA
jgi:uncharacterized protein YpuA (DUF1002 family)